MHFRRFFAPAAAVAVIAVLTGAAPSQPASRRQEDALLAYLDSLSEAERISQLFLVNIEGNRSYQAVERASAVGGAPEQPLVPGGVLFFSYNVADDEAGVISYAQSIADFCGRNGVLRPYLAVDQEGGEVNRLRGVTSTLPSAAAVSRAMPPSVAAVLYAAQARQLRALGFDLNLAPVAEASTERNAGFLGSRSYGREPQAAAYTVAAVRAYEAQGVGTVLKHFPGNTNTDPHTGLPEIALPAGELQRSALAPFRLMIAASPSAVLLSHARTAALDPETPACLSAPWVTGVLQGDLGFGGLVLSDDIFMAALAENGFPPEQAAVQAIDAGVHVIMLSEKRFASVALVLLDHAREDAAFAEKIRRAELSVLAFKLRVGILRETRGADGAPAIWQASDEEQNGTAAERAAAFARAYAEGMDVYRAYRAGRAD